MLIFDLQHTDVLSFYNPNSAVMPTIQGGCFIIRSMNITNIALNTSDIKLIYTKYYSIRTVVFNTGEGFF